MSPSNERMTLIQVIGGAVVLVGLTLARQGDRATEVAAATRPDAGALEPGDQCLNARVAMARQASDTIGT